MYIIILRRLAHIDRLLTFDRKSSDRPRPRLSQDAWCEETSTPALLVSGPDGKKSRLGRTTTAGAEVSLGPRIKLNRRSVPSAAWRLFFRTNHRKVEAADYHRRRRRRRRKSRGPRTTGRRFVKPDLTGSDGNNVTKTRTLVGTRRAKTYSHCSTATRRLTVDHWTGNKDGRRVVRPSRLVRPLVAGGRKSHNPAHVSFSSDHIDVCSSVKSFH